MRLTLKLMAITCAASLLVATGCEPTQKTEEKATAETVEDKVADKDGEEAAEAKEDGEAGAATKKMAAEEEATEEAAEDEAKEMAKVGEAAPDFTLTDQAGEEHTLADYKGKIVVLEWTNPDCPYVKRHYKEKTMTESAASGGEEVAWLAVDSSNFVTAESAETWREEHSIPYPILLDADGKVGQTYAAKTTPHMYVIDKEGVLRYSGAIDDNKTGKNEDPTNYVDAAVGALKEGKEVEVSETKPYGCSVKYGS